MSKATRPVSVAGIEFDALISSDFKMEATVPEYATENGFNVSDSIVLKQESLSMVLYLTETPVTWYNQHGNKKGRVEQICAKLEELYYKRTPVKVITSDKTYTNMAIESITISKSIEEGYSREIPISLRKIRQTVSKTTNIPSSYGKSGTTKSSSGTANTTVDYSVPNNDYSIDTAADSYDIGSSNFSFGSSSSGSSGSILYNIGKSAGIIT